MKLLTKQKQDDMARQVSLKSRDIDICIFSALEGSLPKDMLLDCLMLYVNNDGGFGHGLYIDNYNVNSSVYQVYEAFRLLDMLDFDSSCQNELYDQIINKACNYLYNRVPPVKGIWNPNTKSNNDYAHSKEFEYNEENKKLFGLHPTAALLGYTLLFVKPTKAYYKKALATLPLILKEFYAKEEFTKYELISFNSLLNSLRKCNLLLEDQEKIEEKLTEYVKKNISSDFSNKSANRPLEVALYLEDSAFDEAKNQELDYLIDSIAPHGMWDYNESWGYDKYAEEDSAKLKWIGAGTVNNYFLLKKYGRLE
ncbi:MAG: hypothetical protein II788_06220 [Acholeplasmatales bacterium]|nr:hypothetical protein [Acholeplasmatales bacterium]